MRSIIKLVAILLLALSAGCASSQALSGGSYTGGSSGLRAMLLPQLGGGNDVLRFQLSRPAYVAVFRIVPGYGSSLIYPRPGYGSMDGHLYSGVHRVSERPWRSSLTAYDAGRPTGRRSESEPEFYLLVASEDPLRLQELGIYRYGGTPMNVQFSSLSGFNTMESLVSSIVPDLAADNWTTDYYVHWPEYLHSTPRSGLIEVTCSGYRVWVAPQNFEEAMRMLCYHSPPGDQSPPPVVEPNRRAPVSAAERIASSQLQAPEQWEAARRAAIEGRPIDLEEEPGSSDSDISRRGGQRGPGLAQPPSGLPDSGAGQPRERPDPLDQPRAAPQNRPESPAPPARPEPTRSPEPRSAPPPRESPPTRQSPPPTAEPTSGGGDGPSPRARPTRPDLDRVN